MNDGNQPSAMIREVIFEEADLFDQQKMVEKLDFLIAAWGRELLQKGYIEKIPESDEGWMKILDMEIHRSDLEDQWDHYVVSGLIFFTILRADIKRDFLLQPDYLRGQRLERWLGKLRHFITPLSREVVTQFCLTYSMILERKPIKVRYREIKG
jgi:hypothetical protein